MNLTAGVRHALNSERLITLITINVAQAPSRVTGNLTPKL